MCLKTKNNYNELIVHYDLIDALLLCEYEIISTDRNFLLPNGLDSISTYMLSSVNIPNDSLSGRIDLLSYTKFYHYYQQCDRISNGKTFSQLKKKKKKFFIKIL